MRSDGPGGLAVRQRSGWLTMVSIVNAALALVSIAPFGGPVVPDV